MQLGNIERFLDRLPSGDDLEGSLLETGLLDAKADTVEGDLRLVLNDIDFLGWNLVEERASFKDLEVLTAVIGE